LLYAGETSFLAGTLPFIRAAIAAGEPIMVAVSAAKIDALRGELDGDAHEVCFAEMSAIGANPARIIPAWRQFVEEHGAGSRAVRGIGEPIWAGRSLAELVECQRHEALLNLAFAGTWAFHLLCPYDKATLDPDVIADVEHSHPVVVEDGRSRESLSCCSLESVAAPFGEPLPEPASRPYELGFQIDALAAVRRVVSSHARRAGLAPSRAEDLVVAVNEVATNSVRYADGDGVLRIWEDAGALICEVRDRGRIDYPLAGRDRPTTGQDGGWGLWLANQLCELVQVRSFATGNVVRLHMRIA
jgi:anti-sigma regulatory factor (Ser/Thr protein kinase)